MLNFFKRISNILKYIIQKFLLILIKIYQLSISPFFPQRCNFTPSCSEYAVESIKKHGVFKGLYLSIKRIMKCTPNRDFTYDPVPPKKNNSKS